MNTLTRLLLLALLLGCSDPQGPLYIEPDGGDADTDGDTDADTDSDSDTDSDVDVDTDTDTDTDGDTDTDTDTDTDGDTDTETGADTDTDTDSDTDTGTDTDVDTDTDGDTDTDTGTGDPPVDCSGDWEDTTTGLCWENPPIDTVMDADACAAHCSSLGDGWRMPTIDELRTLIRLPVSPVGDCAANLPWGSCDVTDPGCLEPSCGDSCGSCVYGGGPAPGGCYWPDELLGSCEGGRYMGNSPYNGSATERWAADFITAAVYHDATGHLRCVGTAP